MDPGHFTWKGDVPFGLAGFTHVAERIRQPVQGPRAEHHIPELFRRSSRYSGRHVELLATVKGCTFGGEIQIRAERHSGDRALRSRPLFPWPS